jgi:nitrate reductase gamma subunit
MIAIVYSILYAGGVLFLAGSVARFLSYARQPMHLRWEIYPVPEGHTGQAKVMVPEILFLKALHEFNRSLWYVSYPFHLGLYLVTAALTLSLVSIPAARVAGIAGLALVLAGSLGLLVRRLTRSELKIYTTAGDILNLVWFALTSVLILAGYLFRPAGTPGPFGILRGALTFDTTVQPDALLAAGVISGAALLGYIPLTHMAHFIGKYFTYHAVRWDDRAGMAAKMAAYLTYRPRWSASHVQATGDRTWAEIATTNPTQGRAK